MTQAGPLSWTTAGGTAFVELIASRGGEPLAMIERLPAGRYRLVSCTNVELGMFDTIDAAVAACEWRA